MKISNVHLELLDFLEITSNRGGRTPIQDLGLDEMVISERDNFRQNYIGNFLESDGVVYTLKLSLNEILAAIGSCSGFWRKSMPGVWRKKAEYFEMEAKDALFFKEMTGHAGGNRETFPYYRLRVKQGTTDLLARKFGGRNDTYVRCCSDRPRRRGSWDNSRRKKHERRIL